MTPIASLLEEVVPDLGQPDAEIPACGLPIDDLVGGLRPGAIWRIQGPSESGRTTLALQIAREVSRTGVATLLFTPQHDRYSIVARLLSGMRPLVPLHHLIRGPLAEGDQERLKVSTSLLREASLDICFEAPNASDTWKRFLHQALPPARVVIVDDYDLFAEWPYVEYPSTDAQYLRSLARDTGTTVIVTAATPRLPWNEAWQPGPVPSAWARHADVVIDVDRPDTRGHIERVGEIDLHLMRNRNGPSAAIDLSFQGHYARAVSIQRML